MLAPFDDGGHARPAADLLAVRIVPHLDREQDQQQRLLKEVTAGILLYCIVRTLTQAGSAVGLPSPSDGVITALSLARLICINSRDYLRNSQQRSLRNPYLGVLQVNGDVRDLRAIPVESGA